MEQLTLEQAAKEYSIDCFVNNPDIPVNEVFKAGAEWQKEQSKDLLQALKTIAAWPGNLPDDRYTSKTGANDAAYRGQMVVSMRSIALQAIKAIEPEYIPFE